MQSLPLIWQRLVDSAGKTCDRCGATYREVQQAISTLKEALRPLGIEPTLEIREIGQQSFLEDPLRIQSHLDCGKIIGGMVGYKRRQQPMLFGVRGVRLSNDRGRDNDV